MLRIFLICFNLFSKLGDEIIDGPVGGIGRHTPDLLKNRISGDRLVLVMMQEPEYFHLVIGERDLLLAASQAESVTVYPPGSNLKFLGVGFRGLAAAEQRLDASQ